MRLLMRRQNQASEPKFKIYSLSMSIFRLFEFPLILRSITYIIFAVAGSTDDGANLIGGMREGRRVEWPVEGD